MKLVSAAVSAVLVSCVLCVCHANGTAAQTPSSTPVVSIAHWRGGRQVVVAFTFDDTHTSHVKTVAPMFQEFGYRCTFYICPKAVGPKKRTQWADWKRLAEDGFEVGNHTMGHRVFTGEKTRAAIQGGYEEIRKRTGVAPLTFAFPGGGLNKDSLKIFHESDHIAYRRNHLLTEDLKKVKLKWMRLWIGDEHMNAVEGPKQIARALNREKIWNGAQRDFVVGLMHDVKGDAVKGLRDFLAYIKSNEDKIWVTTYADAVIYEDQREKSTLEVTASSDTSVTFTLTHDPEKAVYNRPMKRDLEKDIYNRPVTVKIQPGHTAIKPSARRGKADLPVTAKEGLLLVDVVPGPDPVTVRWERGKARKRGER